MAASCYSTALLFSLPRSNRTRHGAVSSSSASPSLQNNRLGLPLRSDRRLEVRKSLRVSCIGDDRTPVVTSKSWDKLILENDTPVLVEFYASWCGPCRMVHRVIDEIAKDYSGRLNCFIIDADNDSQIAEKYEIKAVPVVLLFKNGKKCDSVVGTMPKEFYVAAIERVFTS